MQNLSSPRVLAFAIAAALLPALSVAAERTVDIAGASREQPVLTSELAALRLDSADFSFASEQEFVERFGRHAIQKSAGTYALIKGGVTYTFYFGRPALEATRTEIEQSIGHLIPTAGKSLSAEDAAQLERLYKQHAKLERDLLQGASKQQTFAREVRDFCGYRVTMDAYASPGWSSGTASSNAVITQGTTPYDNTAYVEFTFHAFAGQPNYQGGLFGTPSISQVDYASFSIPDTTPMAYAQTAGWQQCMRSSGLAVVRRNPSFPDYCGEPFRVDARWADYNCPANF